MNEIDHFYWNLARVFFGISLIWAILGICCNSIILLTTIKTKSTYNILIAICAIGDITHQAGNLVQFPLILDVYFEVDSQICYLIMFLPEMGIAVGVGCIFCIGIDRMLSVIFSVRYRTLNKRKYSVYLASLVFGYCAYLSFLMVYFYQQRAVVCEVVTPFLGPGFIWFISGNFTVNTMSAIVYFITWMGLRSHTDSLVMKRIVKSLMIVVAVDVSGWFLTPGLIIVLHHLNLNNNQMFAWTYFSTIFIHFAISVKLFIYYSTSSEYRSSINDFLFKKSGSFKNNNSMVSRV